MRDVMVKSALQKHWKNKNSSKCGAITVEEEQMQSSTDAVQWKHCVSVHQRDLNCQSNTHTSLTCTSI